MFNETPIAHIVVVNGTIVRCNPAALRLFACSSESDLIDRPLHTCFAKEGPSDHNLAEQLLGSMALAARTGRSELRATFRDHNSIRFHARMTLVPAAAGEQPGLLACFERLDEREPIDDQARLRSCVATAAHIGVTVCDADGLIVYTNAAFEKMSGYALHEILGKKPGDILQGPLTDPETKHSIRQALDAPEAITVEIRNYHRSGRAYWTELHISPVLDSAGALTHFISIQTDITERREADERFRVLFEQSSDAHLLFDDTGIIDCNRAAIEMLRCVDKAHVLSLHPAVLSPELQPDGRASMEKCFEMNDLARQNGCHRFEWTHRRTDGTDIPVEVTLTPVTLGGKDTLLVVCHDLTERLAAQEQLLESHSRMAALISALPDCLYRVNRDGVCLDNYSRNKPHSLTPTEELEGKRLHDYVPDGVGELVESAIHRALDTGEMQTLQYEVELNGATRYRDTRVVAQSDEVALVLVRDVTASKAAEAALRHSEARLREA